jgi:hypothetical protein
VRKGRGAESGAALALFSAFAAAVRAAAEVDAPSDASGAIKSEN